MSILRQTIASFDVDAQKGFTPLCPIELPVPEGDTIVAALNRQANRAQFRLGSKDGHPRGAVWEASLTKPQFSTVQNEANVDIRWNRHCISGTYGCELLDGLPAPIDYDFFVWKGVEPNLHPYGACYHDLHDKMSTGVIEWLRVRHITTVLVGGLATDYCVKTTVLQLLRARFQVIVNLEACRGISPVTVAVAIQEMKALGATVVASLGEIDEL